MNAKRKRRPWSGPEVEVLRRDYQHLGGPAVADALGRSVSSVYQQVNKLGLAHQARTTADDGFLASLRTLHAEGLTDPEIADRLRCERHTVSRHRRSLGLASNRSASRYRARVAEKTRAQCRAAGVASLAEVRVLAFREYATSSGWPEDLRPREVQILEALDASGPMTRPEIAKAIGLPWIGSRKSLASNTPGGSYLAGLMRRGLVACLGRVVRGEGRGGSVNLYSLSITAERSVSVG